MAELILHQHYVQVLGATQALLQRAIGYYSLGRLLAHQQQFARLPLASSP